MMIDVATTPASFQLWSGSTLMSDLRLSDLSYVECVDVE